MHSDGNAKFEVSNPIMRIRLFYVFLFGSLFLITACTSLVKQSLLHVDSYPVSIKVSERLKQEFNVVEREFCDQQIGCYQYYFAASNKQKSVLNMDLSAHITDIEHHRTLSIQREDLPELSGSVVIVHGFRGSKDWGLISAAYFQFLGFDVYIFDLLGHGDLQIAKGFGVNDVDYIQRFIQNELLNEAPVIVLGHSMGGLVASYLVNENFADAAILQGPMTRFDTSLQGYFNDSKPWYRFLISDTTLKSAAAQALDAVNLQIEQTNTLDLLKESTSPYLIFASNIDTVSPYRVFADLTKKNMKSNIDVIKIDNVEHAYTSTIGQYEHEHILTWLTNNPQLWQEQ